MLFFCKKYQKADYSFKFFVPPIRQWYACMVFWYARLTAPYTAHLHSILIAMLMIIVGSSQLHVIIIVRLDFLEQTSG